MCGLSTLDYVDKTVSLNKALHKKPLNTCLVGRLVEIDILCTAYMRVPVNTEDVNLHKSSS